LICKRRLSIKAIVCTEYGLPEILELKEVEKPTPRDDEVHVKVRATSVTTHNLFLLRGKPFMIRLMSGGLQKPKITTPGSDMAGQVVSVGRNAKRFRPGDEVFGDLTLCGFGAFAEYVCVPETVLTLKPSNITFEEAAAVPQAALVALQGLRDKGHIQKGQKVLIYGASGGIGTFAIQIAKYFGAEVSGVCSKRNLGMVRSIGADHIIDYTKEDFLESGKQYDLIFAIAYRSIFDFRRALNPQGIYVSVGGPSMKRIFQDMVVGPIMSRSKGKRFIGGWSIVPNKDLAFIKELIEAGKVKPVIDRRYTFTEVAKAFRYYAEGHSRGKVVIGVSDI